MIYVIATGFDALQGMVAPGRAALRLTYYYS